MNCNHSLDKVYVNRMGIFFIDIEYTNGNFYLGEVFEIACLSEGSGYAFHSYVKISDNIPRYIQKLCNITTSIIYNSPSWCSVIQGVIEFIKAEEDTSPTIIVGHGGNLFDFPLLIAQCLKCGYDYMQLNSFLSCDSMEILQSMDYHKPGLDAMSNTNRKTHSAIQDVYLLRNVVRKYIPYNDLTRHSQTLERILQYMESKMPLSITELYKIAHHTESILALETTLSTYKNEKTALKEKQIRKIANKYFNATR